MEVFIVRHAQTQNNVDGVRYDNYEPNEYYPITERGKLQAIDTGKYLKKFGNFDVIYSSPRHRCLQTAELIIKEIKFDGKVIKTDKLLEQKAGIANGLTRDEIKDLVKKNETLTSMRKKINDEFNPFTKMMLLKIYNDAYVKYMGIPTSWEDKLNNYREFLENISKTNYKRILVIGHSGTIEGMTKILTNLPAFGGDTIVIPREYHVGSSKNLYEKGNCMLMAMLMNNSKFQLIIPPNNLHLEELSKKI